MLIPSNVVEAVKAANNEAEVALQNQRRWCEAVSMARNEKRHSLKDEQARIDMDVQAVWLARCPNVTELDAQMRASMHHRAGDRENCALWVRIHAKLVNYRRTK